MSMLSVRSIFTMLIIVVLASCGTGEPRRSSLADPGSAAASQFQKKLDGLGLPLKLPPGRAILINIPSYELIALEDGVPVFRSPVIIGKPESRTPRIDTVTDSVIFLPSWRPTPAMVASGEVPDRVFPPGPRNPMGLLVVTLDTHLDIALHDTNQRYLFARDQRAFSHGCIRVQKWEKLAAWLLNRDEAWIQEMVTGTSSRQLGTARVPVLIRHFTVFPKEDGSTGKYPDVYGLGNASVAQRAFRKSLASSVPGRRKNRSGRVRS